MHNRLLMDERFAHGYALIIGIDEYYLSALNLPIVGKDVTTIGNVLVHPQLCAYDPDQVRLLSGEDATNENLWAALHWLRHKTEIDPEATVFIYYAGHVLREKDSDQHYLIAHDTRTLESVRYEALTAETLLSAVNDIEAKSKFLLLDGCHDPGLALNEIEQGASYLDYAAFPDLPELRVGLHHLAGSTGADDDRAQAWAVLSSSSGSEFSNVRPDGRLSLFAYHLIEALTGQAGHDGDAREVTVSDVLRWVKEQVSHAAQEQGQSQNAIVHAGGEFAIAKLMGGQDVSSKKSPGTLSPLAILSQHEEKIEIRWTDSDRVEEPEMNGGSRPARPDFVSEMLSVGGDEIFAGDLLPEVGLAPGGAASIGSSEPASRDEPYPEPQGAVTQARRFEAAMPKEIRAAETTELLVMVPRADGPGLSKFLPLTAVSGDEIGDDDVKSVDAQVEFPVPGEPVLVYIAVEATEYDYDIEDPFRAMKLYEDRDGSYESFLLTPLRAAAKTRVTVSLYGDKERTNKLSTIRLAAAVLSGDSDPMLVLNRTLDYVVGRAPVTINVVGGDQIGGDKVGGDKIAANVIDSGAVAIGGGAQATVAEHETPMDSGVDDLFDQLLLVIAPLAAQLVSQVIALKNLVESGPAASDQELAELILDIGETVESARPLLVQIFAHSQVAAFVKDKPLAQFALGRFE